MDTDHAELHLGQKWALEEVEAHIRINVSSAVYDPSSPWEIRQGLGVLLRAAVEVGRW